MIQRLFKLKERGTSVRTEMLGGVTTFVTMAYIVVVNPAILSYADIPVGPAPWPRSWRRSSALFDGFLRQPSDRRGALYGRKRLHCLRSHGFRHLLAATAGSRIRERRGLRADHAAWSAHLLSRSISTSMKHSFAVGIGFFLSLIGLYETGVVTSFVTSMRSRACESWPATCWRRPMLRSRSDRWASRAS